MIQPSLFDAPRQRHSPTSCAAAESIAPHLGRLQRLVLEIIRAAGNDGVTDGEIIERAGLGPNTPRPRRIELYRAGLIDAVGVRKGANGRESTVWRAT